MFWQILGWFFGKSAVEKRSKLLRAEFCNLFWKIWLDAPTVEYEVRRVLLGNVPWFGFAFAAFSLYFEAFKTVV